MIVYCSYDGRYSDNPRAIYERRRSGSDSSEHVWLSDPGHRQGFPADIVTVKYGSLSARRALESADLVVANTHIEMDWDKPAGARYLQTWHGTPLKRVHSDVLWAPPGRLARLDGDVARWDYLLSPNAASTPRLRSAFRFAGEVLETGYPRNDILLSPRAPLVRARVRASLGLADDTTAVLYAPTWRDDQYFAEGSPTIDLALDVAAVRSALGESHTLLTRLHYMMTDRLGSQLGHGENSRVKDVSRYPDMQELYLAADVLVTDYSSSMFDFAVTGKPMLFYTYDLERYRDSLRGFYFDFEAVAPGPMLRTSAEVIDGLGNLTSLQSHYAERYAAFQRTYGHLDDGNATERLRWLTDTGTASPTLQPAHVEDAVSR